MPPAIQYKKLYILSKGNEMQSIICEKSEKKRILGLSENKLHVFSFNYRLHFSPEWQLFCRPSVANSRAGTARQ